MVGKQGAVGCTLTLSGPVHPMKLCLLIREMGTLPAEGAGLLQGMERGVFTHSRPRGLLGLHGW